MGIFKRAGIAAIGTVALACAASIGCAADASDNFADPLDLFSRIAPVFKHARCTNCHGGVDPTATMPSYLGRYAVPHGGGQVEGDKGGAGDTVDAPPMGRDEFVNKARRWVKLGGGNCGRWKGSITQTETFESDYVVAGPGPNVTTAVKEKARRVVKIHHELNGTTATIEMSGDQKMITTAHESGPRGPCTVIMTSYRDWSNDVTQPARTAGVQFELGDEGWYKLHFTAGSEEKTVELEHGEVADGCGTKIGPPEPAFTKLDWPVWSFNILCVVPLNEELHLRPDVGDAIDCNPYDARKWPRLKGKLTRIIDDKTEQTDPQSWIAVSPVATARAVDGKVLPFKVETEWDFELVE